MQVSEATRTKLPLGPPPAPKLLSWRSRPVPSLSLKCRPSSKESATGWLQAFENNLEKYQKALGKIVNLLKQAQEQPSSQLQLAVSMSFIESFRGDIGRVLGIGCLERGVDEVRGIPCVPVESDFGEAGIFGEEAFEDRGGCSD